VFVFLVFRCETALAAGLLVGWGWPWGGLGALRAGRMGHARILLLMVGACFEGVLGFGSWLVGSGRVCAWGGVVRDSAGLFAGGRLGWESWWLRGPICAGYMQAGQAFTLLLCSQLFGVRRGWVQSGGGGVPGQVLGPVCGRLVWGGGSNALGRCLLVRLVRPVSVTGERLCLAWVGLG